MEKKGREYLTHRVKRPRDGCMGHKDESEHWEENEPQMATSSEGWIRPGHLLSSPPPPPPPPPHWKPSFLSTCSLSVSVTLPSTGTPVKQFPHCLRKERPYRGTACNHGPLGLKAGVQGFLLPDTTLVIAHPTLCESHPSAHFSPNTEPLTHCWFWAKALRSDRPGLENGAKWWSKASDCDLMVTQFLASHTPPHPLPNWR